MIVTYRRIRCWAVVQLQSRYVVVSCRPLGPSSCEVLKPSPMKPNGEGVITTGHRYSGCKKLAAILWVSLTVARPVLMHA